MMRSSAATTTERSGLTEHLWTMVGLSPAAGRLTAAETEREG